MSLKRLFLAGGLLACASLSASAAVTPFTSANGIFTFDTRRTTVTAGSLDRVTLYVLSRAGDILGSDITVTSGTPNGLKFSTPVDTNDDGEPDTLNIKNANVLVANRTAANNIVFKLLAPGYPKPDNTDPSTYPAYGQGLTTFQIAGFDDRDAATFDLGLKAGASQNGGLGAAIFSAVVPTGTSVTFSGSAGDDSTPPNSSGALTPFTVLDTAVVPEPTALGFVGLGGLSLLSRRNRRA